VAIPEVDVGDDVFVAKVDGTRMTRVQVKGIEKPTLHAVRTPPAPAPPMVRIRPVWSTRAALRAVLLSGAQ
jgi:hypothetical protein